MIRLRVMQSNEVLTIQRQHGAILSHGKATTSSQQASLFTSGHRSNQLFGFL